MFNYYNKLGGSDSPNIDLSENPFNWPVDDDGRVQDSPNINLSEQFHQAFFEDENRVSDDDIQRFLDENTDKETKYDKLVDKFDEYSDTPPQSLINDFKMHWKYLFKLHYSENDNNGFVWRLDILESIFYE